MSVIKSINSFAKSFNNSVDGFFRGVLTRSAFSTSTAANPLQGMVFGNNKPKWIALRTAEHFEQAARFNPILNSAITLLSRAVSNGNKVLIDTITGEEIPWSTNKPIIKKLKQLLKDRPNPLQSPKEFAYQGTFYFTVFGNRYVFALMPTGFDNKLNVMNIDALYNLPSQFMSVKDTGKMYNQNTIEGIIEKYSRNNVSPPELYDPHTILHFNEVNFSSEESTLMGISKLESLREPLSNIQACFESINTLLVSGGAKGIIAIDSKDGQGSIVPLQKGEKSEVQRVFKDDYGLLGDQNPFVISPVPLTFTKTAMTSTELGIYKELSTASIMIGNALNIPPEMLKINEGSATFENQFQSVQRLYQDAAIPMANEEDEYWNYRLGLDEYNIKIKTKWDHIPALQEGFKEKAVAINLKGRTAKDAYLEGVITWNEYREMIELDPVSGGDVYKPVKKVVDTNNAE